MPPHPLSGSPRQRERGGAHRQLGLGAPQGDAGRLSAVVGTAFLIHAAVDGIVRKRPVHGADRFQHALPGRAADRAQGGDGVADPQAAFGLVGMLGVRQVVGGQAVLVKIAVQPQNPSRFLAGADLGEQALQKGGLVLASPEQAHGLTLAPMAQKPFHAHGAHAVALLAHALTGACAQELQKRQTKRQRQAVDLLHGKGRHVLPGLHRPLKALAVEGGRAVAHELTGKQAHAGDARI